MIKSESIKELANALTKAQAEMKNPAFDASNPHFRSKYASLAAVRDAVIPVLSKHGLALTQFPLFENGQAGCETMLMHSSGEFISERLLLPVDKLTAHGIGSAQTYSRRYSIMAFACVVGDEDDDGNAAVGKGSVSLSNPMTKAPITPTTGAWDKVTPARMEFVKRLSEELIEHAEEGRLEDAYSVFYGNLDAAAIDGDEGVALWASLGSQSKVRRQLKAMRDERTGKLAETA